MRLGFALNLLNHYEEKRKSDEKMLDKFKHIYFFGSLFLNNFYFYLNCMVADFVNFFFNARK